MAFAKRPVARSADFVRIASLPVRTEASYPADLAPALSRALATPEGLAAGVQLRPVQARSLYDAGMHRRGFFALRVGAGKTLTSFLLPRVMNAQRPLLLIPASLMTKTDREWRALGKHWQVAKHLRFMSYQKLGVVSGAQDIEAYQPDLIIADECHRLKNLRAAVTRRVARYLKARPNTLFVPMSGTMMKRSLKDFAHLAGWALGQGSILPLYAETLTEWAEALDEDTNAFNQREPGILTELFPGVQSDTNDERRYARQVFFRRAEATPGVVISDAKGEYTGSLTISALEYHVNAATDANFVKLRTDMCRPDGWALSEAMQAWAVARQLALGLHYAWNPQPPEEWLDARKAWAQFVRDFLKSHQSERMGIDSTLAVANAVDRGQLIDEYKTLETWRKIEPIFKVNSVEVWHDDGALKVCAQWLKDHPRGICWTDHTFFAQGLSRMTGVPYYGADGLDARENFIEDHPEGSPIIASRVANSTGRNLQFKWSDNLVTAPPADSEGWEQMIGRTHRDGQPEDEVTVDVLVGCREHLESIPRSLNSADVKADVLGFIQKLALADITWPNTRGRAGARWA